MDELKASVDAMAKQFVGLQDMVKQFADFQGVIITMLDKLSDLEAWRSIVETSMGSMMQQSKET
jgi:hypothetical protein